ncbi:MAG: hypothetical protein VX012_03030 [Planctomycetota bacterium]|nr:hypothetical protein [Planctomycetota bacterium]
MPTRHRDIATLRLLPLLLLVGLPVGCGSAPQVRPLAARPVVVAGPEGSPDAVGFRIDLEVSNPGDEDIPLERFEYTFQVDGVGRFEGRWAAFRTLGPDASATITIPASMPLPTDLERRVDLEDKFRWSIDGGVRYQAPGLLGQILFDAGVRRPNQPFSGSGTFRLVRPAGSESGREEATDERGPDAAPDPTAESDQAPPTGS